MIAFIVALAVVTLVQQSRARRRLREIIVDIDELIALCGGNRPTNYSRESAQYERAPRNIGDIYG